MCATRCKRYHLRKVRCADGSACDLECATGTEVDALCRALGVDTGLVVAAPAAAGQCDRPAAGNRDRLRRAGVERLNRPDVVTTAGASLDHDGAGRDVLPGSGGIVVDDGACTHIAAFGRRCRDARRRAADKRQGAGGGNGLCTTRIEDIGYLAVGHTAAHLNISKLTQLSRNDCLVDSVNGRKPGSRRAADPKRVLSGTLHQDGLRARTVQGRVPSGTGNAYDVGVIDVDRL